MESYDTEGLIVIQVAQLEKEKKELSEKLRVVAKRIDHIERAYRKEERPLLGRDYEQQQNNDRETFEALQQARKNAAQVAHQEDMATKARLSRVIPDYEARREVIVAKKMVEFAKRKEVAEKKIEEENAKRKNAVLKAREEERLRAEAEQKRKRELEEEARRKEEGKSIAAFRIIQVHISVFFAFVERRAEEQRRLEEEAAAAVEAERKKREEEEKRVATRMEREAERAAALEKARLQQQREDEAEEHRKARKEAKEAEKASSTRKPVVAQSAVRSNGGQAAWRRETPANSTPPTPTRASNGEESAQRPESPSPAAVPKYRPGALRRAREEAKAKEPTTAVPARAAASPRPSSPAIPAKEGPKTDDDGFQTVDKKGVWRPRRGRA